MSWPVRFLLAASFMMASILGVGRVLEPGYISTWAVFAVPAGFAVVFAVMITVLEGWKVWKDK